MTMTESNSFNARINKAGPSIFYYHPVYWSINKLGDSKVEIVPSFNLQSSINPSGFKNSEECLDFIKRYTNYTEVIIRNYDLKITSNFFSNVGELILEEDRTLAGIVEEKINSTIKFVAIDRNYCVLYFGFNEDSDLESGWLSSSPEEYAELIDEAYSSIKELNLRNSFIRSSTMCNKDRAIELQTKLLIGQEIKTEGEINRISKELDAISTPVKSRNK